MRGLAKARWIIGGLILGLFLHYGPSLAAEAQGLGAANVEVYFTPGPDCENAIVSALDASAASLVAAVYSINNERITAALARANSRGVTVRVLTDRVQAAGRSSRALALVDAGVNLRVHSKFKIEHNKFVVVDDNRVITGSFNWTAPATKHNSENCVVLHGEKIAKKFVGRFDSLWQLNSAEKSQAFLEKLRQKRAPERLPASTVPNTNASR